MAVSAQITLRGRLSANMLPLSREGAGETLCQGCVHLLIYTSTLARIGDDTVASTVYYWYSLLALYRGRCPAAQ